MVHPDGQVIYVFRYPADEDPWLLQFRELMMGPIGWDPEDWDAEVEDGLHSQFVQLIIVYRFQGLTPIAAVRTLLKHPDFDHLEEGYLDDE